MSNNENHGPGFINGIFWGLIIGGSLVFLLGTKKGKKIVRIISEGIEDVSEFTSLLEEDEIEDFQEKSQKKKETAEEKNETNRESKEEPQSITLAPKRFFRGIPKRS